MGKSNRYVFNFYLSFLENKIYEKVAFFGQDSENDFSRSIKSNSKKFFDMKLDNWNINKFPYHSGEKFDLIVCTRCAYFSKDPKETIRHLMSLLREGGSLLIDWGLGDHWRFKNYKVGWEKDNEHEWAYEKENFLWSCVWDDSFENDENVLMFKEAIKNFGYSQNKISDIIKEEVFCVLSLESFRKNIKKINHMFLWPESPQLYTCMLLENIK